MSPGPSLYDCVHIMQTIATPINGMVTNFDLIMYGFSCLITFPYICIYSYFKFCCFASICNTSICVFVIQYTIHGLTYVDMQILQSVSMC